MSLLYLAPGYAAVASFMCLSYSSIESTKTGSKDDSFIEQNASSVQSSWIISCAIVALIIAGVSGEVSLGQTDTSHIIFVVILVISTLSVSSSMLSNAF
jgi:hypothetical protein